MTSTYLDRQNALRSEDPVAGTSISIVKKIMDTSLGVLRRGQEIPEGYSEKGLTLKYKSKRDGGKVRELGYS